MTNHLDLIAIHQLQAEVKQLLKELEKFNDDAEVILWHWDDKTGSYYSYLYASVSKNDKVVILIDTHTRYTESIKG